MVDVGLSQAIVKRLNRWYRSRSRPHGTVDHFYRGTRLRYNTAYRSAACLVSLVMLSFAGLLYFSPNFFTEKSPLVILLVKIGWVGVTAVALGAPIEALREFAVVNDEGVMKSNLLGRQTRLEWGEITRVYINPGDNKVVLSGNTKTKVELSLCYNGWQDFVEISAKHLNPMLHLELVFNLAQAGMHKA
jgi:hypothetical protein